LTNNDDDGSPSQAISSEDLRSQQSQKELFKFFSHITNEMRMISQELQGNTTST